MFHFLPKTVSACWTTAPNWLHVIQNCPVNEAAAPLGRIRVGVMETLFSCTFDGLITGLSFSFKKKEKKKSFFSFSSLNDQPPVSFLCCTQLRFHAVLEMFLPVTDVSSPSRESSKTSCHPASLSPFVTFYQPGAVATPLDNLFVDVLFGVGESGWTWGGAAEVNLVVYHRRVP